MELGVGCACRWVCHLDSSPEPLTLPLRYGSNGTGPSSAFDCGTAPRLTARGGSVRRTQGVLSSRLLGHDALSSCVVSAIASICDVRELQIEACLGLKAGRPKPLWRRFMPPIFPAPTVNPANASFRFCTRRGDPCGGLFCGARRGCRVGTYLYCRNSPAVHLLTTSRDRPAPPPTLCSVLHFSARRQLTLSQLRLSLLCLPACSFASRPP
jgi:hypothetical protein